MVYLVDQSNGTHFSFNLDYIFFGEKAHHVYYRPGQVLCHVCIMIKHTLFKKNFKCLFFHTCVSKKDQMECTPEVDKVNSSIKCVAIFYVYCPLTLICKQWGRAQLFLLSMLINFRNWWIKRTVNNNACFLPTFYIQIFQNFCQKFKNKKLSTEKYNQFLTYLYQKNNL